MKNMRVSYFVTLFADISPTQRSSLGPDFILGIYHKMFTCFNVQKHIIFLHTVFICCTAIHPLFERPVFGIGV